VNIPQNHLFVCPETRVPLKYESGQLVSATSGQTFKCLDGIPCFLEYDPVEDEASVQRLDRLNELASSIGWRAAVNEAWSEVTRYVTDEGRLSYIDLLPLTHNSRVLEIGAALGQHTCELARRSHSVYALEVVPGQARFTAIRCRQEGASNVVVACGGDSCKLPLQDKCFDVVVINLVLEWCASREKSDRPANIQRRLLSEALRVLKADGVLFLATKNRFALRYLTGGRDEHVEGLRFGSALPRGILDLYARCIHKRRMGLLHSYVGLKRMLFSCGFQSLQSFWAAPDMRYPERYVRTDVKSIREARKEGGFSQGQSKRDRLIKYLPSCLVKYFSPGLVFLARR